MSHVDCRTPTTCSELGLEKRCLTCNEYWPADEEFFSLAPRSRDGLTTRCIACIKSKQWTYFTPARA